MGRSEVGTDVRTSVGLFQGRFGDFTPSEGVGRWRGFETPSEGVRKMRESVSPLEGGKGPLGGGTRQYGALEAVLRLLTFGRCAENVGKVPHLRKVGKVCWEVERDSMVLWRRYCVYSPSEGERKMRESASPSEGGKGPLGGGTRQYGALEAVLRLLTFGR